MMALFDYNNQDVFPFLFNFSNDVINGKKLRKSQKPINTESRFIKTQHIHKTKLRKPRTCVVAI